MIIYLYFIFLKKTIFINLYLVNWNKNNKNYYYNLKSEISINIIINKQLFLLKILIN